MYLGTGYASQAAFLAAASADFSLSGNIDATNPFPSGIGGALDSALQNIATSIDGISEIAGDANGDLIVEPLDLGYFPKWANT
jgi:hypothetical protein